MSKNSHLNHEWLDPHLAMGQVEAVAEGLAKADPANAGIYRVNAAQYIAQLRSMDTEVQRMLGALPSKRIITFHDAFPYYAARYGIDVTGVFQVFSGREPTPRRIGELRQLILDGGAGVVFAEPQYSPRLLESVARDVGVPVFVLDPMGTGSASAPFYEETSLANARTLARALGGK